MSDPIIQVLLVEDNRGDAVLIKEALREVAGTSFHVDHAERLEPALAMLQKTTYDVMLLDLSLPDSQGLDTVSRANQAAPQLPIVVLTGDIRDAVAMEAVHLGAQDYLMKQEANSRQISRSIRYAMERKKAQVALEMARDGLELRVRERTEELEQTLVALRDEFDSRIGVERALQDREEIFHQMFEGIGEAIWLSSVDLQRSYCVNPACQELFGLRAEETVRQPKAWLDRVHPDDRPAVECELLAWLAQSKGDRLKIQHRVIRPDGEVRIVRSRFYAIRDPGGEITRICVLAEDVTDIPVQVRTA